MDFKAIRQTNGRKKNLSRAIKLKIPSLFPEVCEMQTAESWENILGKHYQVHAFYIFP